jgi:tetratricopeptide (TPR) repeat protein
VLLVFATVAAYWPSLSVPLFFDDKDAILHNPTIRDLGNLPRVLSPPTDGGGATGRPIVNLSLAIDYALVGTEPGGYHVTNLLLHLAAGLTLFGLVRRTLRSPRLRDCFGGRADTIAGGAALIWMLHPLQTESVACVIQRTELLVGLFYLLTFYGFVRMADSGRPARWAILAVAASLLGMASKEVMVSAPLLVFLYDRTFFSGTFAAAWNRRRPFYLALSATWLLLAFLVVGGGGSRGSAAGFGLGISPWSYLLKQCEAIVLYARLALWPHPLVIDYGNAVTHNLLAVLPQAIALVALAVTAFALVRRRSAIAFLLLWFFAILAPSSSVVPLVTQTIAEHRMYLPLVAVVVPICAGLPTVLGRHSIAVMLGIAAALGGATYRRTQLMGDETALWRDCLARVPDNARAYDNLASALITAGRPADAIPLFQKALALNPRSAATRAMLGDALLALGRWPEAEARYREALAIAPAQRGVRNNLAVALHRSGRRPEALALFQEALSTEADVADVHRNLGIILAEMRDFPASRGHFEQALRLAPRRAPLYGDYARVLADQGHTEQALALYRTALDLAPNSAALHTNLSSLFLRLNCPADAARHCEQAIRLQPDLAETYNNYAIALARLGRAAEARANFERALVLQPDYADARANLDRLNAAPGRPAPLP